MGKQNNEPMNESFSMYETDEYIMFTNTQRKQGLIRIESYKRFFETKPINDCKTEFLNTKEQWLKK
jgi:hypothetical protein